MNGVTVKPYNLFFLRQFPVSYLESKPSTTASVPNLIKNIYKNGLNEPLVCKSKMFDDSNSYFQVEPGQCRLIAMKKLGFKYVPVFLITENFMIEYLTELNINFNKISLKNALKKCKLNSPSYKRILESLNKGHS